MKEAPKISRMHVAEYVAEAPDAAAVQVIERFCNSMMRMAGT